MDMTSFVAQQGDRRTTSEDGSDIVDSPVLAEACLSSGQSQALGTNTNSRVAPQEPFPPYTDDPQPPSWRIHTRRSQARASSTSSTASSRTLVSTPTRQSAPSPGAGSPAGLMASKNDDEHAYYDSRDSLFLHRRQSHPTSKELPDYMNGRPLIDIVTNDWRTQPKYKDYIEDFDEDDYAFLSHAHDHDDVWHAPRWVGMLRQYGMSRRIQRHTISFLVLLLVCWTGWKWWLRPQWEESRLLDRMYEHAEEQSRKLAFGSNMRPDFADMVQVKTLDSGLLPGATAEHGARRERLVFVGDVHGCKDELHHLLAKLDFTPTTDHLILTGDMIAKGPDTPGVIDLARSLHASCVRGNHEDRLLLSHSAITAPHVAFADSSSSDIDPALQGIAHGDHAERRMAAQLSREEIAWLKACPVILRVGEVEGSGLGEILVVHAGLVPGVPLERQDPFMAMNMRSVDPATRVGWEDRRGVAWEKYWNHYQKRQPPVKRSTVVYGHDSKRGLNIRKYSKGLDSGCVNGGKLSALVIGAGGKQEVVSVECH